MVDEKEYSYDIGCIDWIVDKCDPEAQSHIFTIWGGWDQENISTCHNKCHI